MKKLICMALLLVATQAGAIDFSSVKSKELGQQGKQDGMAIGEDSKKGFRIEASARKDESTALGAVVGLKLGAPFLKGDKFVLRVVGGVSADSLVLAFDAIKYQLGIEYEYKLEKNKSFVFNASNRFDPITGMFANKLRVTTGVRFYF